MVMKSNYFGQMVLVRSGLLFTVVLLSACAVQYGEATSTVANGDSVYKCSTKLVSDKALIVTNPGAELTKGCVVEGVNITFDIGAMYKANKAVDGKLPPIVINVVGADFVNTKIKLINADTITDEMRKDVPLLFTMRDSTVTGTSEMEFGTKDKQFKLPQHSHIRILYSKLMVTATAVNAHHLFTFHSLQLVASSTIEIAHNVITMEAKGHVAVMAVFNVVKPVDDQNAMIISDKSTFILLKNNINIKGSSGHGASLFQAVWMQDQSPLTVSENSIYKCEYNNITMQAYKGSVEVSQYLFWIYSSITISTTSHLLINTNKVDMLAEDNTESLMYESIVMNIVNDPNSVKNQGTISKDSSMELKGNCVVMGPRIHKDSHVLAGKWNIKGKSKLLLDTNYFTTTFNGLSDPTKLTEFIWRSANDNLELDRDSEITIKDTQVHSNSGTAANSVMWRHSLSIYNEKSMEKIKANRYNIPVMEWNGAAAKDSDGSIIKRLDKSNLEKYKCLGMNYELPIDTKSPATPKPSNKPTSATAISSTIPAVLICGVVWLYLSHH